MKQEDREDGSEYIQMKIVKDIKSTLKLIANIILSLGITINDIIYAFFFKMFTISLL